MSVNLKENRFELVNCLYQHDLVQKTDLEFSDLETENIFNEIIKNMKEIDEIIVSNLFNYQLERLSYVDRAIIRLATYELKYTNLAASIIINEAVVLTKKISDLDDEKQHKFNNRLLDNINKNLRG